jgi:hypothetical protein
MDADRFDRLTRVAATTSRRQLMRAVGAGLAATVGFHPTTRVAGSQTALGDPCTTRRDCAQTGSRVHCADNGIASDGALNCCHRNGGACARSAECCGDLVCADGRCRTAPSRRGLAPGAPCQSTGQCSQRDGATVCADNGIAGDGALNCCRTDGGVCTSGAGCCGSLLCVNGICQQGSSGDLAPGAPCTSSSQCSQDGGPVFCADNGIPADGVFNCCRNEGGACTSGAGCCGAMLCTDGFCRLAAT